MQVVGGGSIPVNQLKDIIKEAIKDQVKSITQPSYIYAKPYTQRINLMKMPANYQSPKFQQFDGKDNMWLILSKLVIMLVLREIS